MTPARTPFYFTYLAEIVKQFQEYGDCPSELQELLVMEQSRDRFTLSDVQTAAITLGFGSDNALRLDYEEEIPDEFVENAWKDCIKRSWRNVEHGYETQKHANDLDQDSCRIPGQRYVEKRLGRRQEQVHESKSCL